MINRDKAVHHYLFSFCISSVQDILLTNGKKYFRELTLASRKENNEAIETLKKKGIELTYPPKNVSAQFEATGENARRLLVDKLFSRKFLDDVEGALRTYRTVHKAGK